MLQAVPSAAPVWHFRSAERVRPAARAGHATIMKAKAPGSSEAAPAIDYSALLAAVGSAGDRAAFATIFRHFAPRVRSYLQRRGGTAASAEELMQETMVAVWRKADRYDPAKASASTWIFTVARNLRIDAYRRDRRPEIDPDDPALAPDPVEPPDDSVGRGQEAVRLAAAVRTLSDAEQKLLRLAFFDHLSHSAISERLDLPLGTVKSRLRLAFGKLRGALSGTPGGSP